MIIDVGGYFSSTQTTNQNNNNTYIKSGVKHHSTNPLRHCSNLKILKQNAKFYGDTNVISNMVYTFPFKIIITNLITKLNGKTIKIVYINICIP